MAAKTKKSKKKITEIDSTKIAQRALKEHLALEAEIAKRTVEAGIPELAALSAEYKSLVTEWAVNEKVERIEIDDTHHATLISQFYDSRFIGTADDLTGEEAKGVIPLRTLLRRQFGKEGAKEIWHRVTRRVVDRELVEEVIAEGILTVDDVAPAFVEKQKKPYLRIFVSE